MKRRSMRIKYPAPGDATPWVRWFAWYPVTIEGEFVWFEQVETRKLYYIAYEIDDQNIAHPVIACTNEYRFKEKAKPSSN